MSHADLSHSSLSRAAEPFKGELLARLAGPRTRGRAPGPLSFFQHPNTELRARLRAANVVGLGYGAKVSDGRFTGDTALRVYVSRKLPFAKIARSQRIPKDVAGVPTDVIRVGRLRLHGRPALIGASVSHVTGLAGSLGGVVARGDDETRYVLSAAHVFAPDGHGAVGDAIVEPANGEGAPSPFATLVDFEPLRGGGERNAMDAAIARVNDAADVSTAIPAIGPLRSEVAEAVLYQSVRKFGASTRHTLGLVTDVAADARLFYDLEEFSFGAVLKVTGAGGAFSAGGDSGALVVDALSGRCVGLIVGGNADHTFVTPIARVLDRFGARIAGSP